MKLALWPHIGMVHDMGDRKTSNAAGHRPRPSRTPPPLRRPLGSGPDTAGRPAEFLTSHDAPPRDQGPLTVGVLGAYRLIRQAPIHEVILGQRKCSMRQGRDMEEEKRHETEHLRHERT